MNKIIFVLACSLIGLSPMLLGSESLEDIKLCSLVEENPSVFFAMEDKIYINPEHLIPTTNGLHVVLENHQTVSVPVVYSDSMGCYMQPVFRILNKCKYCGEEYFLSCKNPDCPSQEIWKNNKKERQRKEEEHKKKKQKR